MRGRRRGKAFKKYTKRKRQIAWLHSKSKREYEQRQRRRRQEEEKIEGEVCLIHA